MSFPFIVRELDLPKRAIILQGRSLPYRPVGWGGKQEIDAEWYPGNPVASAQVIGPQETKIPITGTWKDKFLSSEQNRGILANFPKLTAAAKPDATERGGNTFKGGGSVPSQYAQRARVLRDAFDLIRKSGVRVKIEWGSLVRYGFVESTWFPHDREEDISYQIGFLITGDRESQPKPKARKIELLSALQALLKLMDDILNELLGAVFAAQMWLTRVNQHIKKIGSFVTSVLEAIESFANFAFAPADVLSNLRSQLTAIKLAARDLHATLDAATAASVEAALLGNPAGVALNMGIQQRLRHRVQLLAAEAARQAMLIEQLNVTDLLGTVTMAGNQTLRDVAREHYDNADNWRVIAEFNGFGTSIVPRGTLVRLPRL